MQHTLSKGILGHLGPFFRTNQRPLLRTGNILFHGWYLIIRWSAELLAAKFGCQGENKNSTISYSHPRQCSTHYIYYQSMISCFLITFNLIVIVFCKSEKNPVGVFWQNIASRVKELAEDYASHDEPCTCISTCSNTTSVSSRSQAMSSHTSSETQTDNTLQVSSATQADLPGTADASTNTPTTNSYINNPIRSRDLQKER